MHPAPRDKSATMVGVTSLLHSLTLKKGAQTAQACVIGAHAYDIDRVAKMRWIAFFFVTWLCYARPCPDPRLQQAAIGGDRIDGIVQLHHKPLKFTRVQLFFSDGKSARVGTTDKDGRFHIRNLRPDTYRLEVRGWGHATIRMSLDLNKLVNGHTPFYFVELMDGECIRTRAVTN